jgi:hypothetical protein
MSGSDPFDTLVWDALKGDHNDLRRQANILQAYRNSALAHACALYDDAIDMMFDGPDESDEGYAKARWQEARCLFAAAQGIEARQGGDGEAGSVHESPVGPEADAPNPCNHTPSIKNTGMGDPE